MCLSWKDREEKDQVICPVYICQPNPTWPMHSTLEGSGDTSIPNAGPSLSCDIRDYRAYREAEPKTLLGPPSTKARHVGTHTRRTNTPSTGQPFFHTPRQAKWNLTTFDWLGCLLTGSCRPSVSMKPPDLEANIAATVQLSSKEVKVMWWDDCSLTCVPKLTRWVHAATKRVRGQKRYEKDSKGSMKRM